MYTGYLDVDYGAKHMFFYFFESRRDPDNGLCAFLNFTIRTDHKIPDADDVLMWINGGTSKS